MLRKRIDPSNDDCASRPLSILNGRLHELNPSQAGNAVLGEDRKVRLTRAMRSFPSDVQRSRQHSELTWRAIEVVADVSTDTLLLPEELVERLGLGDCGVVMVTPAEVWDPRYDPPPPEYRAQRPVAGPVAVRLGNRSMVTDCVVAPRGTQPRVGNPVLQRLDLHFDYDRNTVVSRYPDFPLLQI